nr:flagellar basal body protein [uncultured Agathobaculum sp.]
MATFGEFTVARLGMIASQMALNVTGQNISNINTPGYTRQQLDQYSFITNNGGLYHSSSSANVGSGVMLAGVSQLRDPYLDIRFRKEMASVGSTDATLNVLDQLQSVINNVDKEGIVTQLQDLFSRISELGNHVGEQEFETLMRESAQDLCTLLNASASKLQQVYDNMLQLYDEDIQDANNILEKIQELNEQIRIADINGDSVLELRDQRNTLIDSLSEYMKIDVTYGKENLGAGFEVEKLTIKMVDARTGKPGQTLIDGISRADLTLTDSEEMLLNIGELFDPDGIQTSDTNSRFLISGLRFDKNATDGAQDITVKYTDANGVEQTVTVSFNVTAPGDPVPTVDDARRQTLGFLQAALEARPEFRNAMGQPLFDITIVDNGISMVSKDKGAGVINITGMELDANADISFSSQKATPAVVSNKGDIENGMGYGALESTRQMLVGAGEFSTLAGYSDIRGIPYYMRSLDMLANKLATEMNRVNTTDATGATMVGTIDGAGNLFVAAGDNPDDPSKLITAANISVSEKWQNGETNVVPSTKPDAASTENDNINRFLNILNEAYSYKATDIVRPNNTSFTSGALTQENDLTSQTLTAQITYLDSMNQKHTIEVDFTAGADADDTILHLVTELQTTIQNTPELDGVLTVTPPTASDTKIKFAFNDGAVAAGRLCSVVTGIQITGDDGQPVAGLTMGAGTIDAGEVTTANIYKGNIESGYSNMEGVLGSHINTTSTLYETYATAADEINTSRDSVSGVDLNDEGINLLQYQKSFAAACRLMTALDEAMDKVINGMGIVGR